MLLMSFLRKQESIDFNKFMDSSFRWNDSHKYNLILLCFIRKNYENAYCLTYWSTNITKQLWRIATS